MEQYTKLYINGQWRDGRSSAVLENVNAYTNEVMYTYHAASREDVNDAYAAARAAQPAWGKTMPRYKQELLINLYRAMEDMRQEIMDELRDEGGSTVPKAEFEYEFIRDVARNAVNFPLMMDGKIMPSNNGQDNYVFRKPRGVISVIAPWNFPLALALCAVIPAVATGNAVVLKPASDTPGSGALICKLFEKAGFPAGLVNYVAGKGSEIGDYFVGHAESDFVYFTGSTAVGRHLAKIAAEHIKPVSLELGGNNVMMVLEDADMEKAVSVGIPSMLFNQGQVCMSLNRIVVVKERYDEFLEAFAKAVQAVKFGNPADPEVLVGPSINTKQAQDVMDIMQRTVEAGARVVLEGKLHGNVVSPWILADCTNDMPACKDEIFGPAVTIIKAENEEDAIRICNDTNYGLSNCIITEDIYHGMEVAQQIETGMSHINAMSVQDEAHVMFGGAKESGLGRTNGEWVVEKFTEDQWISVTK